MTDRINFDSNPPELLQYKTVPPECPDDVVLTDAGKSMFSGLIAKSLDTTADGATVNYDIYSHGQALGSRLFEDFTTASDRRLVAHTAGVDVISRTFPSAPQEFYEQVARGLNAGIHIAGIQASLPSITEARGATHV